MAVLVALVLGISTPSGNIKCFTLAGALHCDIAAATYRPQLQQKCQARAGLDWHGFEVSASERGTLSCSGGALATVRTRPLPYGRSRRSGAITCTSRVTGLTCTAGTHGIFISRASWRGW